MPVRRVSAALLLLVPLWPWWPAVTVIVILIIVFPGLAPQAAAASAVLAEVALRLSSQPCPPVGPGRSRRVVGRGHCCGTA
ncbi:hypothetical protein EV578_11541 [Streptomyces sp. BK205]|nr:hypothetical protein EV578_11541 [Streptomyces sp. BK205]